MATELTAERLAELRRLVAKATPGPWRLDPEGRGTRVTGSPRDAYGGPLVTLSRHIAPGRASHSDARLIVAMRNALPELLRAAEERERMQTWVGLMSLLDQHWPEDVFPTTADDAKRDDGARIVSLLRWVDRLRAENETLRKRAVECMPMLETLREALGTDLGSGGGFVSVLDGIDCLRAQRDALVALVRDWVAHADAMEAAVVAAGGRVGSPSESAYQRLVVRARESVKENQ